jgi:hypothetical protein
MGKETVMFHTCKPCKEACTSLLLRHVPLVALLHRCLRFEQ